MYVHFMKKHLANLIAFQKWFKFFNIISILYKNANKKCLFFLISYHAVSFSTAPP